MLVVLATVPTDSTSEGFLPAAIRRGQPIWLLTDHPEAHRAAYRDSRGSRLDAQLTVVPCQVQDHRAVLSVLLAQPERPVAVFSGSDHLQMQAALVADYFGLPAKDWRAAWRVKNKAVMRAHLAAAGIDRVWSTQLEAGDPVPSTEIPFPVVVKPREGVASEDVERCETGAQLKACIERIRRHRPGAALLIEEFLPGRLHTLETLGDGTRRHVLGGFVTELSEPPHFIEQSRHFDPEPAPALRAQVERSLDALGVHFGSCHTEFVVHQGRARLIEVNYRSIGDHCDLMLPELTGVDTFALTLAVHFGEPLPTVLHRRTDRRARMHYLCAPSSGTLVRAPAATELTEAGVRLTYRPLRAVGTTAELTRTNRDYLGVVRASGADQDRVDRAVAAFVSAHEWTIA